MAIKLEKTKNTGGGKSDEREKKKKNWGRTEDRKKKTEEEETKKKNREKPEGAHVQPAEHHAFITISFVLSRGNNRGG